MRAFTHPELEALAREQGLPEASIDTAAAIAMAESGGVEARGHPDQDPGAHQDSNGRWSIGLWQINSLDGARPGLGRDGVSNDDLALAVPNAQAMARISSRGTDWTPWGAFTNGSFRQFLKDPEASNGQPPGLLRRGSRGPGVCRLQQRLRVLGHHIDVVTGCPFGPQTEAAVRQFQRHHHLVVDGVVGPRTDAVLFP
ncbi:MAG: hypothetical protein QOG82_2681 [Actinomycetota bacterium]|jgi:hypothetical protein|nr:hypothetical protein [Actinomycetota bacterium]